MLSRVIYEAGKAAARVVEIPAGVIVVDDPDGGDCWLRAERLPSGTVAIDSSMRPELSPEAARAVAEFLSPHLGSLGIAAEIGGLGGRG